MDGCKREKAGIPDLFGHEFCRSSFIFPLPQEELTQERVEGFLLRTILVVPRAIARFQGTQEPFEDQQSSLGGISLGGGGDEDGWVLGPVGGEFGER